MKRWLVSSFAPFGGAASNSSLLVMDALKKREWRGQVEFTTPLPVSFTETWPALEQAIRSDFDGVLALGQAERRSVITPERVALNWIDAPIADNSGKQPKGRRIRDEAPELLWSNIDWDKMPPVGGCEVSYSAGVFVCNHLLFQIMEWANKNSKLGGFVHVPLLDSQTDSLYRGIQRLDEGRAVESVAQLLTWLVNE